MNISQDMKDIMVVCFIIGSGILLVTCLINCTLPSPQSKEQMMKGTDVVAILKTAGGYNDILVVRDADRHATCYLMNGGISCIPDQFNKLP